MCRNIKPLFNFDPPATDEEIHAAALQFVRKISGFQKPSQVNQAIFDKAVEEMSIAAKGLLRSLVTPAAPRDREVEIERAKVRSLKRFGSAGK
jgi:hypothetical protein